MRLVFILFLSIIFLERAYTSSKILWEKAALGESFRQQYNGPLFPEDHTNLRILRHFSKDDRYADDYFFHNQGNLVEMRDFLSQDLTSSTKCSDSSLSEKIVFIQYLFRLVSINYLFETLNILNSKAYELTGDRSICQKNWPSFFSNCKARSQDMKLYLSRLQSFLKINPIGQNYTFKNDKEQKELLENLNQMIMDPRKKTIALISLRDYCRGNNCSGIDKSIIQKSFSQTCNDYTQQLASLCSETDNVYGISDTDIITDVLKNSSLLKVIDEPGGQCLERFVTMFKIKENYSKSFTSFLDASYNTLSTDPDLNYPQGRIFVPGAFKEFDKLGLKNFLFSPIIEKRKVIADKKVEVAKPDTPIKKIESNTTKADNKKTIEIVPAKKKKETPSSFEIAVSKVYEQGEKNAIIDMKKYAKEFRFPRSSVELIRNSLTRFQNQNILKNMKIFDKLGSQKQPMRLSFIKFLYDERNHQGLFNLVFILGEQFYVLNDIEKKKEPVLVEIKNNLTTKNKWQLKIISENLF